MRNLKPKRHHNKRQLKRKAAALFQRQIMSGNFDMRFFGQKIEIPFIERSELRKEAILPIYGYIQENPYTPDDMMPKITIIHHVIDRPNE